MHDFLPYIQVVREKLLQSNFFHFFFHPPQSFFDSSTELAVKGLLKQSLPTIS